MFDIDRIEAGWIIVLDDQQWTPFAYDTPEAAIEQLKGVDDDAYERLLMWALETA